MSDYMALAVIIFGLMMVAVGIMLGVAYVHAKEIEREES